VDLIQRAALLLLLLCLGCSAQSSSPSDTNKRLVHLVRAHFGVPASVDIKIGDPKSSDLSGYDTVPVTLTRDGHSNTYDFLLSKDGKRLVQMIPIDDPMDKIDLTGRPVRGAKDAKVTMVVYDDFQCPFCGRNHQTLFNDVMRQYGDRVRVIYKDYPLYEIHPWANRAAIDSDCLASNNADAYWDFADYVHGNQKAITGSNRPLNEQFATLDNIAVDAGKRHGANLDKLQACLKAQPDGPVKASVREAEDLGVHATPMLFINGEKLDGAIPPEELRAALDRALKDAGQSPPATTAQSTVPSGAQH
jgi:protein-disulfide isomerase